MSEPTYKILLEHQPQWEHSPYHVTVKRVSDDAFMWAADENTHQEALRAAVACIRRLGGLLPLETVYATEEGMLTDEKGEA